MSSAFKWTSRKSFVEKEDINPLETMSAAGGLNQKLKSGWK